ncbi:MAG: DUF2490 domain-containing protein [Kiritimatiellia bacterium]
MKRLAVMAVAVAVAAQAQAFREGDSQLWLGAGVETKAGADWRLGVDTGVRIGDSMSDYFYETVEPLVVWKAAPWLDLGAGFEIIRSEKNGEWLEEKVPKANLTIKGDAGPLQLSNRSRLEYRFREEASDEWRYRNRLRLQLAKGRTDWKLKPFVEDEFYFSFDEQLFNENRAAAGLGFEPRAWLKAELYYMARSTLKSDEWTDSNIIGIKATFSF